MRYSVILGFLIGVFLKVMVHLINISIYYCLQIMSGSLDTFR